MNQRLKLTDIIAIGFMLFAFFLGAGNIIFPPMAGQLAGHNLLPSMGGFLLTAVGLPLSGIIAVAIAGGSWEHLTKDLPVKVSTLMASLIFIIIGPAFAAPRTGLVAYEMAVKPLLSNPDKVSLAIFSVVFFAIAMFFSWSQGKLIDMIGKILTPVLFLCLAILAIAVFVAPQGDIMAAQKAYATAPFTTGFFEGYNTMDTFASLMFGILVVEGLKGKGITDAKATTKYLISAAVIAAAGLAFVYISLFYLGATSGSIAAHSANGGEILSIYIQALFGSYGQIVLSIIVALACLTTAIGLLSSVSDYFSGITPISYRQWVVIIGIVCAVVANVGLNQLISLSVPVLFALYPVAIALVVLAFVRKFLPNPTLAYRVVLLVSLLFALVDAAKQIGVNVSVFNFLPLFQDGMGWVLPTAAALVVAMFLSPEEKSEKVSQEIA
ncbi:branched-chain amino acid transport system II carrier protein [Vibrio nitrifigilis]|uniref:Branched-chain amino acid transport system carrier protein n=1 Tax=Vibrio nitrifigilis TaxID=2789781 RepID=A0ABS0G9Z1_9VIBR|nr:branched-chain amino acid transport system II carrier protein [Vibrio nitrifigilis]MBF8999220.1 branched-chain amino acid transport system II carrier protein [Vibrio nitrifigilis]